MNYEYKVKICNNSSSLRAGINNLILHNKFKLLFHSK